MEFYEHSGRCGPVGVPIAAASGIVAGAICGLAYAYIINWIPLIYVSFIATLGFGFVVGAAVAWGARIGKIRNMMVSTALGALVGLVALYCAWVFDPMARIDDVHEPFWRLEAIWAYMKLGYAVGFWGIGQNGGAVTGPFLAAVWIIEAVMVVGVCIVTVRKLLGEQPFCEETGQWTTNAPNIARLSLVDDQGIEAKLKRLLDGDLGSLAEFYRAANGDPAVLQLDLATCPDCPACNFLTVKMVQLVVNKKGETSKEENRLLVNLRIAPDDVAAVQSAGVDRPPPTEDETAADSDDAKPATQDA
jgi:hypothetical protein